MMLVVEVWRPASPMRTSSAYTLRPSSCTGLGTLVRLARPHGSSAGLPTLLGAGYPLDSTPRYRGHSSSHAGPDTTRPAGDGTVALRAQLEAFERGLRRSEIARRETEKLASVRAEQVRILREQRSKAADDTLLTTLKDELAAAQGDCVRLPAEADAARAELGSTHAALARAESEVSTSHEARATAEKAANKSQRQLAVARSTIARVEAQATAQKVELERSQ